MQHRIWISLRLATSFVLAPAPVPGLSAQQLHFDGLPNTPAGGANLGIDAAGNLVVDNLGSSGLDGVRVQLGESLTPMLDLQPGESCLITSRAVW